MEKATHTSTNINAYINGVMEKELDGVYKIDCNMVYNRLIMSQLYNTDTGKTGVSYNTIYLQIRMIYAQHLDSDVHLTEYP